MIDTTSDVTLERVPLAVTGQLGIAGIANRQTASATRPIDVKLDVRSIRPAPPSASEKPRTSSRLPTTLPDQRTTHDLR